MFNIIKDYNELKANEGRWSLLKDAVAGLIGKVTNDEGSRKLLISKNTTFQLLLFVDIIAILTLTLGSFYLEDNKDEDSGFTNSDILKTMYDERDFLSFLAEQLTLEIRNDWKNNLIAKAQQEVEDEVEDV